MYKIAYFLWTMVLLFIWSESKAGDLNQNLYTDSIPVILGVHTEHEDRDSLSIKLIAEDGSVHFQHKGLIGWGMKRTEQSVHSGKYNLLITWLEDGVAKKTQREVQIKPETKELTINIELANEPEYERDHNAIYLDQYTEPLSSVSFNRKWNPQKQFEKDSILIPNYMVTNNNDSTIYGAYLRYSSQLFINWVQMHYIAFMQFELKHEGKWMRLNCSAPRIEMDLPKGKTGKTLTDMVLGCPTAYLKKGVEYRIRINYMLNNRLFEKNDPKRAFEDNVYVEQTIYSFTDEFVLE
jgi:hypothetical protein